MITVISSILAFASGFVFCLFCLVKCSNEKWYEIRHKIEEARKENDV